MSGFIFYSPSVFRSLVCNFHLTIAYPFNILKLFSLNQKSFTLFSQQVALKEKLLSEPAESSFLNLRTKHNLKNYINTGDSSAPKNIP